MQRYIHMHLIFFPLLLGAKTVSFLKVPDPHCKTGHVSVGGEVCCPSYCGECGDHPSCSSVRGQDSAGACCKTQVKTRECGHGAPANTCLKKCTKSVPPCIMDTTYSAPDPNARHAKTDCNEAIQDWRDMAENAMTTTTTTTTDGRVHFDTNVHIWNFFGAGSYLDVCGNSGCGNTSPHLVSGGYEVSTTDGGHHRDGDSGTWKIEKVGYNPSSALHHGDEVRIYSPFGSGSYLHKCGEAGSTHYCGGGHEVSTAETVYTYNYNSGATCAGSLGGTSTTTEEDCAWQCMRNNQCNHFTHSTSGNETNGPCHLCSGTHSTSNGYVYSMTTTNADIWVIERDWDSGGAIKYNEKVYIHSKSSGYYLETCEDAGCNGGYAVSTTDKGVHKEANSARVHFEFRREDYEEGDEHEATNR